MHPIFKNRQITLYNQDCIQVATTLPENSLDAIVTDPPYEIDMSTWDSSGIAFNVEFWKACLHALKPGAFCLVFGSPRMFHHVMVALESAGFRLVDTIAWLHAQGMSHGEWGDHAVDRALGHEDSREQRVFAQTSTTVFLRRSSERKGIYQTQSQEAAPFRYTNPQLKPAYEPIIVAQKPFPDSLGRNLLKWGTGVFNMENTAIPADMKYLQNRYALREQTHNGERGGDTYRSSATPRPDEPRLSGRYPSNAIIAHEVVNNTIPSGFYFHPKAGPNERPVVEVPTVKNPHTADFDQLLTEQGLALGFDEYPAELVGVKPEYSQRMAHATVKPLGLIRYLIELTTREGGLLFEPFAGSGTALEAAVATNRTMIASELDPMHIPLILSRFDKPIQQQLF